MGMIQKQGNWVPYELRPRDVERRLFDINVGIYHVREIGSFGKLDDKLCMKAFI